MFGGFGVERDGVLVDRDADVVEEGLRLAAGHAQRGHVHEHEVVVRAAATRGGRRPARSSRRGRRAFSIVRAWSRAELVRVGQLERDRLGRDDVHQRAALDAREDALVDACAREFLPSAGKSARSSPPAGPRGRRRGRRAGRAGSCGSWWSRGPRAGTGWGAAPPPRDPRRGPCPRTAARRRRGRWPPSARSPCARVGGRAGDDHLRPDLVPPAPRATS